MTVYEQSVTVYISAGMDLYGQYEKQSPTKHNRRCIDGRVTGCGNCVGYCRYREHPGFLTAQQRKQHDCLKKGCFYYVAKPKKQKEERKCLW